MNYIIKTILIVVPAAAVCAIIWWASKGHKIRRSGLRKKATNQPKITNTRKPEHGVKSNAEILTDEKIDSQGNCNEIYTIESPHIHLKTGECVHSPDIPRHRSKIVTLCSETQVTSKMFLDNYSESKGTKENCQKRTNEVNLAVGAELKMIEKPRERGEMNPTNLTKTPKARRAKINESFPRVVTDEEIDCQDEYNDNCKNVLQNVDQNIGTTRDVPKNCKMEATSKMFPDNQQAKATEESGANGTNQAYLETKLSQPEEKQQEHRFEEKEKGTTSEQSHSRRNYDTENYGQGENVYSRRDSCNMIRDNSECHGVKNIQITSKKDSHTQETTQPKILYQKKTQKSPSNNSSQKEDMTFLSIIKYIPLVIIFLLIVEKIIHDYFYYTTHQFLP